jgi:hypothetical protein
MKKYRWLNRRVAKLGPYLTLCLTPEEQIHALRGLTKENIAFPMTGALCTTLCHEKTGDLCCIVSLSQASQAKCEPIEIAGLLVHEAVHIWQQHAKDIGETNPGLEQEAYAIQGISQELMAEYARRIS